MWGQHKSWAYRSLSWTCDTCSLGNRYPKTKPACLCRLHRKELKRESRFIWAQDQSIIGLPTYRQNCSIRPRLCFLSTIPTECRQRVSSCRICWPEWNDRPRIIGPMDVRWPSRRAKREDRSEVSFRSCLPWPRRLGFSDRRTTTTTTTWRNWNQTIRIPIYSAFRPSFCNSWENTDRMYQIRDRIDWSDDEQITEMSRRKKEDVDLSWSCIVIVMR